MGSKEENKPSPYLVWMDLEMTGLLPEVDAIIEIATVITDNELNIIDTGPHLILHQEAERFSKMDEWNREHHKKSGLWDLVIKSNETAAQAEKQTLEFIKTYTKEKQSPLCGNSVWQDRRFLARHMPKLEDYLHYRLVDVSTLKELCARWYPQIPKFVGKKNNHRALEDIHESIAELRYYQQHMLQARNQG